MKKLTAIIILCIILFVSSVCVGATEQVNYTLQEVVTDYIVLNDANFVPLRKVFEPLGANVYYRSRDCQILALTRDGDMIRHVIGENTVIVNGVQKTFQNPSVIKNNETYIPMDMMSAALCPDGIFYKDEKLSIQKYFFNEEHQKAVKDVLDMSERANFCPEKFQRYIGYHKNRPDCSMDDVVIMVNMGLDYPFYENVKTIENPYMLLTLVNKYNQLPAGFTQYNLVDVDREHTIKDGKVYLLESGVYQQYIKMSEDAKQAGLSMRIASAYRTEEYQRNLYNKKLKNNGQVYADNYSARAGFSEHQLGLAIDINSTKTSFENSQEFKWLQQHAHEYGFILRYPKGKEWITGYAYEPWHYRYVGIEIATLIHEKNITYEEFCAIYLPFNEFI